jgi:hypothetical protein
MDSKTDSTPVLKSDRRPARGFHSRCCVFTLSKARSRHTITQVRTTRMLHALRVTGMRERPGKPGRPYRSKQQDGSSGVLSRNSEYARHDHSARGKRGTSPLISNHRRGLRSDGVESCGTDCQHSHQPVFSAEHEKRRRSPVNGQLRAVWLVRPHSEQRSGRFCGSKRTLYATDPTPKRISPPRMIWPSVGDCGVI